tara:strand:- start:1906 stop:2898 length:993 start_codon:yes stop_codon:yes gene_type:complete
MQYQQAFASEIDPYAMGVAHYNHPDVKQIGSVLGIRHVRNNVFKQPMYVHKGIDLLMAGPPCQPFSFAGNQLNFNDERAKPTIEFFRLFHQWKPKYFLIEETPMKKEYMDVFSREFGCEPRVHNSASVSAQNRKRLYWTNIPHDDLPDLGINLEDILEDESMTDREKAYCVDANYFKGGSMKMYFEKARRQVVFNKHTQCRQVGEANLKGYDIIKRVYSRKAKSSGLTTMQGGWRMPKVEDGDLRWRALTPLECERLQTMPDWYTKVGIFPDKQVKQISNSRRYKMIGNGWTVDVIKHILNGIPEQSLGTVVSLFDGCGCGYQALKGVKR